MSTAVFSATTVRASSRPNARARGARPSRASGDWAEGYLTALEGNLGRKTQAAVAAGVTLRCVQKRRRNDVTFEEQEREIMAVVADVLESEILRRAVDGVQRTIFGKGGVVLGVETTYSDTLLLAAAKRVDPSWRDKQTIEVKDGAHPTRAERLAALEKARAEEAAAHSRS